MKRIIDIDKLQEAQQRQKKQKSNYWQRIKNDPVKFGHYKEWRKQYVNKKKEKEARALSPPPIVVEPLSTTFATTSGEEPTSSISIGHLHGMMYVIESIVPGVQRPLFL